jgi:hypothetical protein
MKRHNSTFRREALIAYLISVQASRHWLQVRHLGHGHNSSPVDVRRRLAFRLRRRRPAGKDRRHHQSGLSGRARSVA